MSVKERVKAMSTELIESEINAYKAKAETTVLEDCYVAILMVESIIRRN